MLSQPWKHKTLIWQLLRHSVYARYRGSVLGILWSLGTPLIMLGIYTFVFQYVFKLHWDDAAGALPVSFAIVLFLGMTIHGLLGEIVTKSATLITGNRNFVKKIVFPLELLSCVALLDASCTFLIHFVLVLVCLAIQLESIPITALLFPFIVLPYLVLLLGISWLLAALGAYLRDIQQVTGILSTALLFFSPVFYPLKLLPEELRTLIFLNPLSYIVESARAVLVYGTTPGLNGFLIYTTIAIAVAAMGYLFFRKVRPGFADVL
jgi:lipopolysaccharide transport system permease protein